MYTCYENYLYFNKYIVEIFEFLLNYVCTVIPSYNIFIQPFPFHFIMLSRLFSNILFCINNFYLVSLTLLLFIVIDHYRTANTPRIFCPNNCGRSYLGCHRKQTLKRHLKFECGMEPRFQCSICNKRFTYKSNLIQHKALVHGLLEWLSQLQICVFYY